jgi:hypothetical protein
VPTQPHGLAATYLGFTVRSVTTSCVGSSRRAMASKETLLGHAGGPRTSLWVEPGEEPSLHRH